MASENDINTYHLERSKSDLDKVSTLVAQILTDVDHRLGWPGKVWNPRRPGRWRSRWIETGWRSRWIETGWRSR